MSEDRVSITITDGIADVRMTRADKRNALDNAMFAALAAAGERLKTEPGVRVVVLSGEGSSFCAGLDFATMSALAGGGERAADRPAEGNPGEMKDGRITHLGQQVCWVWQEVPVPVIAAVHGHALGGGIQIALGADIRIVHPDTQMSVREIHWGLVPDMTGTMMLSQLVRADVAKELVLTARVFDGREAHQLGLVTKLSDNPYDDAMAMARDRRPQPRRGSCGQGTAERVAQPRRGRAVRCRAAAHRLTDRSAQPDRGSDVELREAPGQVHRPHLKDLAP